MLRPAAYLTFILEGADIAAGKASGIKRAYSYIAPTRILGGRESAGENEPPLLNRIALEVSLGECNPWQDDAMWNDVVAPWLTHKLDKLFGTVHECNNETRRSHCGVTHYQELDLGLCGVNIQVCLEPDSSLRALDDQLAAIRAWRLQSPDKGVRYIVPSDTQRAENDWFEVVLTDGSSQRVTVDMP